MFKKIIFFLAITVLLLQKVFYFKTNKRMFVNNYIIFPNS